MKALRPLPDVWKAMADPTRRQILDRLRVAPQRSGELAEQFEMTRFGVRKHLQVLEGAGLVVSEVRGRERWLRLNPIPIREIHERWLRTFEIEDSDRLLRLRRLSESLPDADTMTTTDTVAEVRHVSLQIEIDAPRERVWKSLVQETAAWWHKDFYTAENAKGFHIEPVLGGKMYEDWGDGAGQIWALVIGVRAPEFLQVAGDSSRDWGGPNRNLMTWRLEEHGTGTLLKFENSVYGRVTEGTADSLEKGWMQLFAELKSHAEARPS